MLASQFCIIRHIYAETVQMPALFVFTWAVVDVLNQNDEQEGDNYDPWHDGRECAPRKTKRSDYSTGEEKLWQLYTSSDCPRPCGSAEFDLGADESWHV